MRRNNYSIRQQPQFPVWPWEPVYRSYPQGRGRASQQRPSSHRYNNSRPSVNRSLDARTNHVGSYRGESRPQRSHDTRRVVSGGTVPSGRTSSSVLCDANTIKTIQNGSIRTREHTSRDANTTSKAKDGNSRDTLACNNNQGTRPGSDTTVGQGNYNKRDAAVGNNRRPTFERRSLQSPSCGDRYAVQPYVTYTRVEQVLAKEKMEALPQSYYRHSQREGDASRQPASYLQGCRVSPEDGSVTCCLSPALLSQLESRQLLLSMVGGLNSGGGRVLVGADPGTGCVRGASAGAGVLGAFVRGVLSIDRTLILPRARPGQQPPRCGVRCVPVESSVTKTVLRDTWLVEIHLYADKSEYYNPYCSSDYYQVVGGGVLHCTAFKRFCCSVLNTCAMTYAASPIQQMYEEVMDLEERLKKLHLSKVMLSQPNDSENLSRSNASNTGEDDSTQRERRKENASPDHGAALTTSQTNSGNPFEVVDSPRAGVDNPRAGVDNPRAGVDNPRAGVDNPRAGVNNRSPLTAASQALTIISNVKEARKEFHQTGSSRSLSSDLPKCGALLTNSDASSAAGGVVALKMTQRGSLGDVRTDDSHLTLLEGTSATLEPSSLPGSGHTGPGIMCQLCWFKDCPINCYAV